MSVFQDVKSPTYIVLGKDCPKTNTNYNCLRLFPFYGKTIHHTLHSKTRYLPYKGGELFFTSLPTANVIVKTSNLANLAFTTHMPKKGATIPVTLIATKRGDLLMAKSHIYIKNMIMLSVNTYVVNPDTNEETILVTNEM